jgi:putative NIF3 family GTP cyclohydrolase 1 type 2
MQGVDTIIGMHYSIENMKAIIESGIAAIITGHMASDSIGLNIFCDKLEEYDIKIIKGPGFYRVVKNEKN